MNNRRPNNNQRYQHDNRHQNNGYQHNNRSQQDPNRYRRQELERELTRLNRLITEVDAEVDALYLVGMQIEADLRAHSQKIPVTLAQEITRTLTNALHVPFMPPAYRNWDYERRGMLRAQNDLKYKLIRLASKRQSLEIQIGQIQIDIDQLKYY
jgi:hypothetical protein